MFRAQSKFIQKEQQNSRLRIKNTELQYFVSNLAMIGSASALLAGFALGGFHFGYESLQESLPGWKYRKEIETVFLLLSAISMSMSLLAVCHTTLCTMYAPGLALRGPDPEGSVFEAATGLLIEHHTSKRLFFGGLFSFIASAMIMCWFKFLAMQATMATAIFGLTSIGVGIIFRRQHYLFRPSKVVTDGDGQELLKAAQGS